MVIHKKCTRCKKTQEQIPYHIGKDHICPLCLTLYDNYRMKEELRLDLIDSQWNGNHTLDKYISYAELIKQHKPKPRRKPQNQKKEKKTVKSKKGKEPA